MEGREDVQQWAAGRVSLSLIHGVDQQAREGNGVREVGVRERELTRAVMVSDHSLSGLRLTNRKARSQTERTAFFFGIHTLV
jgi:hypothetical protein